MRYKLILLLVVALASLAYSSSSTGSVLATHLDTNSNPLPHATISIWSPKAVNGTFGNDPNMTVGDAAGATGHVATDADPLTIVTVYENTGCSGLPCGVTYWNPETNVFKCYGYSGGLMTGVDVNRTAPLKAPPAGTGAPPTNGGNYGPGDTWLAKTGSFNSGGSRPLSVQFPGSDDFRSWNAGNLSSVAVDQASGLIWYTDQAGVIGNLDPATNVTTRWSVGGLPRDVVVDASGNAYATVESTDQIVRIDPSAALGSQITMWAIPGGGLDASGASFNDNPDGIGIDSAGRIWFAESVSDEIGRLDPSNNTFAEYSKTGLNEPQNVAVSGSGDTLQTFFSEGAGNSVGIVTEVEAAGTSQELITVVAPTTPATEPTTTTLPAFDHSHLPTTETVIPVDTDVEGLDGVPGSGATKTPTGEWIPGIIRFPMPALSTRATGMTGVVLPNTVFGSLIGSEQMYRVTSGAIIAPPDIEPEGEGRMTGGGSIPMPDAASSVKDINAKGGDKPDKPDKPAKASHGFTIQCDLSSEKPNNIQVNWGDGNKFHLEGKILTSATCSDDPGIDEGNPVAGFDTFVGSGTGRYNGESGATIEFTFTDAGEPGINDEATILIKDVDDIVVLDVSAKLEKGNHQAHPFEDESAGATLTDGGWVHTAYGFTPVSPIVNNGGPISASSTLTDGGWVHTAYGFTPAIPMVDNGSPIIKTALCDDPALQHFTGADVYQ